MQKGRLSQECANSHSHTAELKCIRRDDRAEEQICCGKNSLLNRLSQISTTWVS